MNRDGAGTGSLDTKKKRQRARKTCEARAVGVNGSCRLRIKHKGVSGNTAL